MRNWVVLAVLLAPGAARAEEGMWTFDDFPSEKVEDAYGFAPGQRWLSDVRQSSLRLANGCSSSFVSKRGLVMTNHHCVVRCVQQLSSPDRDLVESGFVAREATDELKCPAMEANQLVGITDVTDKIRRATAEREGQDYIEARQAAIAEIEKSCGGDAPDRRCDVVTLYGGGQFQLYEYRRFQDVRLVFAPPVGIAFFGGDPDNFNFPRYALDVAFLRVYEKGRPRKTKHYFRWSKRGIEEGELTFMAGHPGRTSRLNTMAQLRYERDILLPETLFQLAEVRGLLVEYSRRSPEKARQAKTALFGVENGLKALKGRRVALVDTDFFSRLARAEDELRARVRADSELSARTDGAWSEIADAMAKTEVMRIDLRHKEFHRGFGSALFRYALDLVRYSEEKAKPNGERLPEFTESRLPSLQARLAAPRPVYPELEVELLGRSLEQARAELGPDDPYVKALLEGAGPYRKASELVAGCSLADPAVRMQLFEAGVGDASDPMLAFARVVDRYGREIRKIYESEVEAVIRQASERIAAARFAILGTETYPDATFSLRLTYGQVAGFPHRGRQVPPFTTVRGLFERATDSPPFALPEEWTKNRSELQLDTPMNFVTNNDIIGGNSGSPVFNAKREIVGVVFDGNIYSLGGKYGFDPRNNRAVSVDARFIRMALDTVYGARHVTKELGR